MNKSAWKRRIRLAWLAIGAATAGMAYGEQTDFILGLLANWGIPPLAASFFRLSAPSLGTYQVGCMTPRRWDADTDWSDSYFFAQLLLPISFFFGTFLRFWYGEQLR